MCVLHRGIDRFLLNVSIYNSLRHDLSLCVAHVVLLRNVYKCWDSCHSRVLLWEVFVTRVLKLKPKLNESVHCRAQASRSLSNIQREMALGRTWIMTKHRSSRCLGVWRGEKFVLIAVLGKFCVSRWLSSKLKHDKTTIDVSFNVIRIDGGLLLLLPFRRYLIEGSPFPRTKIY